MAHEKKQLKALTSSTTMHHLGQKKSGCILRQPTDRRMLASFLHLLLCTVLLFVLHFAQAKETPHPKRNCNCSAKYCCSTVDGLGDGLGGFSNWLTSNKTNNDALCCCCLYSLYKRAFHTNRRTNWHRTATGPLQ